MAKGCIFIVGYMGVGKSSGGRRLARTLELPFADTDLVLMDRSGKEVSALFEEWGEPRFRKEEARVLRELTGDGSEELVIATGGGTPCHEDNMDFMLAHGTVLHFEVALEPLVVRLAAKRKERPLIADIPLEQLGDFVNRHMADRAPFYSRAHITVDAGSLDGERLASVARMIRRLQQERLNP